MKDGLVNEAKGDTSERIYGFKGRTKSPANAAWTFPGGCGVVVHVREMIQADELFKIPDDQLSGADIFLTLDRKDGAISQTKWMRWSG